MNALGVPVILQLVGVLIIIAEIILPSGGLLTLLAVAVFGYSLYVVFTQVSVMAGTLFLCADLLMVPILVIFGLKMLARSPVTLRSTLSSGEGVTSQNPEMERYLGKTGRALSDLRPSGAAVIEGKRLDVVSRGEYIDRETIIEVVRVTANQIVVKAAKP